MKKILFAMAALATLASCQKAEIAEQNSINTNGERVITAYFDNAQTKTTLDGVTPKWIAGDKIMLLDGSDKQEITLEEGDISNYGKSVTITTTLGGTIYAVYPSTATNAEEIETENIVPVTLKAEQDGTFGSANICVAKENDGSLAFKNVTSVLHLTQTAATTTKVNEIIITTPSAYIAGTGTVDVSAATPALTLSAGQSKKIKVKSASVKTDYYIAVVPTTLPAGTAFGFATGSELGGTNLSGEKTIAANTIYNIGSMDAGAITPNTYHAYVEINGLKWATMNLGATSVTEYSDYYMWGATELAYESLSGNTFTFKASKPDSYTNSTWNASEGFAWKNCQYTNGTFSYSNKNVFTKYTTNNAYAKSGTKDDKTTLEATDDIANKTYGGSWRMPTKDDFVALAANGVWYRTTNYNSTDVSGYIVYVAQNDDDKGKAYMNGTWKKWTDNGYSTSGASAVTATYDVTDPHIFFPAAGSGDGTSLNYAGSEGYYWSSGLRTDDPSYAHFLFFTSGSVYPRNSSYRCYGFSVRPVSD